MNSLLALLLAFADAGDDLKKAIARTAELGSYFYQWEIETTSRGKPRRTAGAGEYVAPDLLTLRTGILELARKGDRARVKAKEGWVAPEKEPAAQPLLANLKPPHELLAGVLGKAERLSSGKDAECHKVNCKVVRGRISGDALRELVRSGSTNFELFENLLDWEESAASVEAFIDAKNGWLVRVTVAGELKPNLPEAKRSVVPYKRRVDLLEPGTAKPSLPPEVRKGLGLDD